MSVNRDGRIFVDQTPVSYNDFRVTFRSLVATRKPQGVYLQADTRVPYGQVVRVLAIIRSAGIQNVGLVAAEEEIAVIVRADRGRPPGTHGGTRRDAGGARGGGRLRVQPGQAGQGGAAVVRGRAGRGARRRRRSSGWPARPCRRRRPRRSRRRSSRPPKPKPTKAPAPPDAQAAAAPRPSASRRPRPRRRWRRRRARRRAPGTDVATIKTPGLAVSVPGVPAEHRDPGLPATGTGSRPGRTASPRSASSSCGTARCGTSGSSPGRAASASTSAPRAPSRPPATPAAFGQLPDGWDADVLPVSFYFKPKRDETILPSLPRSRRRFAAARRARAAAQDTTRVNEGVRVGVDYQPGVRPGPGGAARRRARLGAGHRPARSGLQRPVRDDRAGRRAAGAPRPGRLRGGRRQLRHLQGARGASSRSS